MHVRLVKEGESWLDIIVKAAVVTGVCFAMTIYVFSIRPAFEARRKVMEAESRLSQVRQSADESEKVFRQRQAAVSELDRQLQEKQKELSWLEVSLEKKSVEKTFLVEQLADLENRFAEVKMEAVRAYLLKMMNETVQESIRRGQPKGRGKSVVDPFDVRGYALMLSQAACRTNEEGSYKYAAAKLFEEFAREKLPEKGSKWDDLIAIIHWYPTRLYNGAHASAQGG